jgi:photosystem II stability/assembly factor-like uncharacterized protein
MLVAAALLLALAGLVATWQSPFHDVYGSKSLIDWLRYPLERNAPARLLTVRGHLTDIAFAADGHRGFAVGDGGLILETEDAGLHWRKAYEASGHARLNGVAVSANGEVVVAVGDGGTTIFRDAGETRWAAYEPANAASYYTVAVSADGRAAWAAGADGLVSTRQTSADVAVLEETSVNGVPTARLLPEFWENRTIPGAGALRAIGMAKDGKTGWTGGDSGLLYETSDGGGTWVDPDASAAFGTANDKASFLDPALVPEVQGAFQPASYVVGDAKGYLIPVGTLPVSSASGKEPYAQQSLVPDSKADTRTVVSVKDGTQSKPTPLLPKIAARSRPARAKPSTVIPVKKPTEKVAPGAALANSETGPTITRQQTVALFRPPIKDFAVLAEAPPVRGLAGIESVFIKPVEGAISLRTRVSSGEEAPVVARAIAFASTTKGWVVGDGGLVARTTDGGDTWEMQAVPYAAALNAVTAASDGLHAWAVGDDGTLLATRDGGTSWFRQLRSTDGSESARAYVRFPAPWFYLALITSLILFLYGMQPHPAEATTGAAAIGASDAPTASILQDKLQFAALARGISRFLRNEATTPPMTLAISGDWGTGKSSLMQMVCEDLRAHGSRPVWFNAWHHQGEEQLLAALLAAIREKAMPHWYTPAGLWFRAHLFWLRALRSPGTTLFLLAVSAFLVSFFMTHGLESWKQLGSLLSKPWGDETKTAADDITLAGSLATLVPQIGGLVAVFAGVRRALKSFGADPAVLLTSTIDNFKLRDASAQINFRSRFQTQFSEVTAALPYSLVIVIDDLDRCSPQTVLSVMESVNFLLTSGNCFVIFGMATQRVQAALALSFKDIAHEFVTHDSVLPANATADQREEAARQNRYSYAGDYLQKLINLEIRVPTRADIEPHLLLMQPPETEEESVGAEAKAWLKQLWPLAPAAAVLIVACIAGMSLDFSKVPEKPAATASFSANPSTTTGATAVGAGAPAVNAPATSLAPAPPPTPLSSVEITPPQDSGLRTDSPIAALFALVLAGVMVLQFGRRRETETVRDSDAFAEALKIWTPVVAHKTSAPRAIKRFGNRLRYLAMLQQADAPEPGTGNALPFWKRWRREASPAPSLTTAPKTDAIAEHRIVALGAIQAVYGDAWRARIEEGKTWSELLEKNGRDFTRQAIDEYVQTTNTSWPPSAAELDAFDRSLKGIRLGGDVSVLSDKNAPKSYESALKKMSPIRRKKSPSISVPPAE